MYLVPIPPSAAASAPTTLRFHRHLFLIGKYPFRRGRELVPSGCVRAARLGDKPSSGKGPNQRQNIELPPILPKNKKKPYPVPVKRLQRAARAEKKLADMGIEKPLEPPKNGLLVPELVPVAYEVLEEWKELIRGLGQLLHVVPVYGCRDDDNNIGLIHPRTNEGATWEMVMEAYYRLQVGMYPIFTSGASAICTFHVNAWCEGAMGDAHVRSYKVGRHCPEVHVGPVGHQIQDCRGKGNVHRRSFHSWVGGSINDILLPIESYHMFDPFGPRIKHETRFKYDRIPAVVELCIQAGVQIPAYPSRRRTRPIRMMGKKVLDRGGYVEHPKPSPPEECSSILAELDTYSCRSIQPPLPADVPLIAERTLKAYGIVRRGVSKLMKKYTVKACGYCSEVHVGPWGHNAKLCGAFKHQWRDGKHGWQDAVLDEVLPPNFVWHVKDPEDPPLTGKLVRFYGKAPAVVEICIQAGAEIPDVYKPMMRLDIVVPQPEEASLVA